MRNFILAISICILALGFSTTVYAFPALGDDCSQCHGGGGGRTPGCGPSSGCDRRGLFAENQSLQIGAPAAGDFDTAVTEENGFTFIHPVEMDSSEQVILYRKKLTETRQGMLEKIASHGVVVAIPAKGQSKADCIAILNELNNDSASKFCNKIDLGSLLDFDE